MTRSRFTKATTAMLAGVALAAAGCGVEVGQGASGVTGSGSGGGTKPAKVEAGSFEGTGGAVFLSKAAASTGAVKTLRMNMELTTTGSPIGELTITADGEFDNEAERGHLTMDLGTMLASLGGGDGNIEMVIDGKTVYMKSELLSAFSSSDKPWLKVDAEELAQSGATGTAQNDPGAFLEFLEGAGGTLDEVGREEVRGVPTTHVRTTIDLTKLLKDAPPEDRKRMEEQLDGLGDVGGSLRKIPAEAWVDDDGYVRKFTMSFDLSGADSSGSGSPSADELGLSITFEMYDFDQPVDISVPDPSEVGELDPSVLNGGN